MRENRIFIEEIKENIKVSGDEWLHIKVMRPKINDLFTAFDGKGNLGIYKINFISKMFLEAELLEHKTEINENKITLAICLLKNDKLANVVRAATEIGILKIQLIISEQSDIKEINEQKLLRLNKIALEATKQSKQTFVPEILPAIKLKKLPDNLNNNLIIAHPRGKITLSEIKSKSSFTKENLTLLTGPEGGFSDNEIDFLESKNAQIFYFGKNILRAQTAPIAILGALI